jgi:rubrerythrin
MAYINHRSLSASKRRSDMESTNSMAELRAKIEGKSPEEVRALVENGELELPLEELDSVSGGESLWESFKLLFDSRWTKCPQCKYFFLGEEEKDWQKCPRCGEVFIK